MIIINDDSRVVNKLEASLTDDARVIIYHLHMFIVQATDVLIGQKIFFNWCRVAGGWIRTLNLRISSLVLYPCALLCSLSIMRNGPNLCQLLSRPLTKFGSKF